MRNRVRYKELRPIPEVPSDYDAIEKEIRAVLRDHLYIPLIRLVTDKDEITPIQNAKEESAIIRALRKGTLTFGRGVFAGKLDAKVTKELRSLGATWDRKAKNYRILAADLPPEILEAAKLGTGRFLDQLEKCDELLRKILPAKIADSAKLRDHFDTAIFKTDKRVSESLAAVTVQPTLTAKAREIIADEWQENARLYIRNFTAKEVKRLRAEIKEHVLKGGRFEHIQASIRKSYGVTERKAKFLARQETSLLMSKFKKARYTEAGSHEYRWRCVAGSPKHPVRPSHKKLDGTIQRWDSPPITTAPSQPIRRCHPGEDFECRCTAIPVVRF